MADSDSTLKFEELEVTDEERARWRIEGELSLLHPDSEAMWFESESRYRCVQEEDRGRHLIEMEATTNQEKQACEAVNAVLKEIIKKSELKKICAEHEVDHEFLTEVLNNLENCVTEVTLLRLEKAKRDRLKKELAELKRKQQLKLEMQKSKGKLTSADDEIPSSKKIRICYSLDGEANSRL